MNLKCDSFHYLPPTFHKVLRTIFRRTDLCAKASHIFFGTPGTEEKIVFLASFFKPLIKSNWLLIILFLQIQADLSILKPLNLPGFLFFPFSISYMSRISQPEKNFTRDMPGCGLPLYPLNCERSNPREMEKINPVNFVFLQLHITG